MSSRSLAAPLVDSEAPKLHWIANLALPQPAVALVVLAVLSLGSLCCSKIRTEQPPGLETGSVELASQPLAASFLVNDLALAAIALVVVFLVATQLFCDQAVKRTLGRACGNQEKSMPHITAGPLQSCFFLGTFEWRNCSVQNPLGYKSDSFIHVGIVKAKADMARFLLSCGRQLVLKELLLDDVTVTLERLPGHTANTSQAEDHSNVTDTLRNLDEVKFAEATTDESLLLNKVEVPRCKLNIVGSHLADMPSMHFEKFSDSTGATTFDRCFQELLQAAGRAAVAAAATQ